MTKNILTTIDGQKVSTDMVKELQQLVNILSNGQEEVDNNDNEICNDSTWPPQKRITRDYVEMYKNNALETLASTVIENVHDYLVQRSFSQDKINKNQIGKDLVELGVKKTRKSKGYVYGIEDTKEKSDQPKFNVDTNKVLKKNHQLRRETYTPDTFSQQCLYSVPARFLVPSNK